MNKILKKFFMLKEEPLEVWTRIIVHGPITMFGFKIGQQEDFTIEIVGNLNVRSVKDENGLSYLLVELKDETEARSNNLDTNPDTTSSDSSDIEND